MAMTKAVLGQVSDVDIRLLRVFRAVVDCGGFSAAELELNIGRSTISRHIKDLEDRLGGLILCSRGRGGFALSDEGREVYDATLRLLSALDSFRTGINDLHQQLTGTLTLVFFDKIATNPDSTIHTALGQFSEEAPEVELSMHVEGVNNIESGVLEGKYDIGIIPMHRPSTTLAYHHMFDEHMYLYCGRRHPLFSQPQCDRDDDRILACNYAGLGYHSPNMEVSQALQLRRRATAYDQEAIAILIRSGHYIAFLPDHYARFFVEQEQMRRIENPRFYYLVQYSAIVRRSPKPSRQVQTFLRCLEAAQQKPAEGG